jgi:hypothetical protein
MGSNHFSNHCCKVLSLVATEGSWDVLPEQEAGSAVLLGVLKDPKLVKEK